jgi:glycosyltransferase involved in cell wall biosynthesis
MPNTDAHSKTSSPLISYVIICYNQEAFIVDAIRSASLQDYSNTEIIISDDCSTDDTFNLAVAAVKLLSCDHKVIVRQTKTNLGLIGNFKDACRLASGKLIVMASGDDVSLPNRTSRIVEAWLESGAAIISSDYDTIDNEGKIISMGVAPSKSKQYNAGPLFKVSTAYGFAGATAAYLTRMVWDADIPEDSGAEDIVMMFYAYTNGYSTYHIDEKLVLYRSHNSSMSHLPKSSILNDEISHISSIKRGTRSLGYLLDIYNSTADDAVKARIDIDLLEREIRHHTFRETWPESCFLDRLRELLVCRKWSYVRWLAPRVFGLSAFVKLKSYVRR